MSVWQVRCLTATGKNVCWLDKYIRLLLRTIHLLYRVQGTIRNNSSVRQSFRRHRVWTDVGARFSAGDTSDGRLRVSSTCTEHSLLILRLSIETLLPCYEPNCLFFSAKYADELSHSILLRRPNGGHTNSAQDWESHWILETKTRLLVTVLLWRMSEYVSSHFFGSIVNSSGID